MKKILFGIMAIAVLAMFSCNNTGLGPAIGGTVLLSFDDGVTQARTILPTQSMDLDAYDIYGVHEDGEIWEHLDVDITGTIVIPDLLSGEWTLTVDGKNDVGTVIGTGSNTVVVTPTSQSQVTIIVTPTVGDGTLNLDVGWSVTADGQMNNPGVLGQLFPYGGTPVDLTYTVDQGAMTANYNGDHGQGYYTLLTQFVDVEDFGDGLGLKVTTVAGNAEVVRIAAGDTSDGTYYYDDINPGNLGEVEIIISPELGEPLIISLTPNVDGTTIDWGDTFTMDATTMSTTDTVEWTWYVNGIEYQVGGATLNYDSADFPKPGFFGSTYQTISCIGYSNAGTRGGSTSVNITTDWVW